MGRLTQDLRAAGVDFDAKKLRPLRKQFRVPYELEYNYEFNNGLFLICYSTIPVAYIVNGALVRVPGIVTRDDVRVRRMSWRLNYKNMDKIGSIWAGDSLLLYWADAPHLCVEYSQLLHLHCMNLRTRYTSNKDPFTIPYVILVQNLLWRYYTPFIEEVVAAEIIRKNLPGPIADEICDCITAVISRRLRGYNYKIYAWNSRAAFIQETLIAARGIAQPRIVNLDVVLEDDEEFARVESWEDGVEFIRKVYGKS